MVAKWQIIGEANETHTRPATVLLTWHALPANYVMRRPFNFEKWIPVYQTSVGIGCCL